MSTSQSQSRALVSPDVVTPQPVEDKVPSHDRKEEARYLLQPALGRFYCIRICQGVFFEGEPES